MDKVGIFVDHDIIIRNFLDTNVFSEIEKNFDVELIFPKNHPRVTKKYNGHLKAYYLEVDNNRAYKIRYLYHLQSINNLNLRKNKKDKQQKKKNYIRIIGLKKFLIIRALSALKIFSLFKLIYKLFCIKENRSINDFLCKRNYKYILHPTVLEGLFIYDLIEYKKKKKSNVIFLMNSWDNPSNKALIDNFPNILAVWGEQTQNHCIDLLKVPPANIKIIGSPQLNMYKKFVTKKNKERVLCFAGSSLGLNETKHLDCIEKIIEEKKINLKVLYKPHPWKSFHKEELFFDESQFKHIKIDKFSKQNYNFRFNGGTFNLDLIKNENTLKTLANIDCLITPLSTIMLEAAICKIPFAVYIPKQKLEMNSSFFGQENNLIYQEFLSRIDCKSFSDYKNYENILLDLIDKCNNNNYRDQLKKDARFFCDLSKDYKKCIGELLNV